MINKTQSHDPVLAEIHRTREQIAEKFGGDITAILDDARQRQAASGRTVWQGASNDAQQPSPADHPAEKGSAPSE